MSETPQAVFQACFADWKLIKTRACVQIVFEVPIEKADEAYAALGGMPNSAKERWFAIARLNIEKTTGENKSYRKPVAPDKRLAQRAALLCKDHQFWKFLEQTKRVVGADEESAAAYLRDECAVDSRSEIMPETIAGHAFDMLQTAFVAWRDSEKYVEA
jgi:hypothetical protein